MHALVLVTSSAITVAKVTSHATESHLLVTTAALETVPAMALEQLVAAAAVTLKLVLEAQKLESATWNHAQKATHALGLEFTTRVRASVNTPLHASLRCLSSSNI